MTNLKQLDKNVDAFEEIVNNLSNFSEVSKTLKESKDTIVTWIQELKTIRDEVVKNTSSIEKKYDVFTKETKESIVTWVKELTEIKENIVKHAALIEKKYDKFTGSMITTMEENKNDINRKLSNNKSEISAVVIDQWIATERWLRNAFNSKNFVLIILIIISLLLNGFTLVYLFLNFKK